MSGSNFLEGDLEREVGGFFLGIGTTWERYTYSLKGSTLTQHGNGNSSMQGQKIKLAGATIKTSPNMAKIEELHLTPLNAGTIKLRDTVTPSKHSFLKGWYDQILKGITEAPAPEGSSNRSCDEEVEWVHGRQQPRRGGNGPHEDREAARSVVYRPRALGGDPARGVPIRNLGEGLFGPEV